MNKNQIVVMDSEAMGQLLNKIDTLADEVRRLTSEREMKDKYYSADDTENQYLTPGQLAKRLNKSISTIYTWRAKGIITGFKIGGSTFFSLQQVLKVLNA